MSPLLLPKFANETEEANWWYDHRDEIAQEMIASAKEGRLGEGSRARWERKQAEAAKSAETAALGSAAK